MNHKFFSKWKEGVLELNEINEQLAQDRDDAYKVLSDEIRKIFTKNGLVPKNIQFKNDGSLVWVFLDMDTSNSIHFKKTFLFDIGMSFSVKRRLTDCAEEQLYLELYPLEED